MIDRIIDISHAVILSEGWRRRLVALAAGAVGALAMPPIGAFPVFALSFPVAIWLIDGCTAGPGRFSPRALVQAAQDGWWFGFGYFLAGLWWIGAAFLVETDEFAWAIPLGVLGLPAVLAVFPALGFALARLIWAPGAGRLFAFAVGLGLSEWLRHWAFTGFPWNGFGQGLGSWLVTAQAASLIGADGLALATLVIFAAPARLADPDPSGRPWRRMALAGAALAVIAAFGLGRLMLAGGLASPGGPDHVVEAVRIRLVQPNISQRDKNAQRDGLSVLTRLFQLSDRSTGPSATGMADATHLVWPESPFPFVLSREQRALAEIARQLPPRTTLLTGAVRVEEAGRDRRFYNTLHVFGARGALLRSYDKQHLVPFGEYLPLESVLSAIGLRRFVHAPGAFAAGAPRQLLEVPGLPPVLPLICYEAIFPHEIGAAETRPGLIVNITNDAWFGETFGPHQHFAQARLRAIEIGAPLVRGANTGISGLVDSHGRIVSTIPLGAESIIDVFLPRALTGTIYWSHGRAVQISLLLFAFLLAVGIGPLATLRRSRPRSQA